MWFAYIITVCWFWKGNGFNNELFVQTWKEIWQICHTEHLALSDTVLCVRLSYKFDKSNVFELSDVESVSYSAWTDLAHSDVDSGASVKAWFLDDYYAVLLLFDRYEPWADLGDVLL